MRKSALFFFLIFISFSGFGQNNDDQVTEVINHEVQLGESVRMLSKKYKVEPAEIYRLNTFAVNGISQGMVLHIPAPKKKNVVANETENTKTSEIISQTIPETDPQKKVDDELVVNQTEKQIEKAVVVNDNFTAINHKVEPKETLFSLSKKYNVSVEELKNINEQVLKNGLKIGQLIKIPSAKKVEDSDTATASVSEPTNNDSIDEKSQDQTVENTIKHKVEPKETLFGISKKYNVTVDEIKQQNAALLQKGLQIGQILIIKRNN